MGTLDRSQGCAGKVHPRTVCHHQFKVKDGIVSRHPEGRGISGTFGLGGRAEGDLGTLLEVGRRQGDNSTQW